MFWEKKVKRSKMPNININIKRAIRIRHKLKKVNTERYRLTIHRSSKNISAQIIDDKNSKTLISASSLKEEKLNKKKADLSLLVAQELAKKVYRLLGCKGFSRIDMILKEGTGEPVVLEINTIPGLTPNSLLPKSAKAAGIPFSELLEKVIMLGLERN